MTKYAKSNNMDYDKLYKCADNALYYVKNNGKDDFHIYASAIMDGGMDSLEQEQLDVQQLIQRVAERKEYMGAYRVEYDSFSYIYRLLQGMWSGPNSRYRLFCLRSLSRRKARKK